MRPYIFLLLISAASATNCSHYYDGHLYTRHSILTIKGVPTNLVVDPSGNLLFTLFDLVSLRDYSYQTEQYILTNGAPIKIDNGQAASVDPKTGRIFIASDDGLHELNNSTLKTKFLALQGDDIVGLFKPAHTDEIYMALYPNFKVYAYDEQNNEKRRIANVLCASILAVDSDDNIYYTCESKYVRVLLKGFQEPIAFVGLEKGTGNDIAVDFNNKVVLAADDGLYHLRPDNMIPRKLMNLDFVPYGIAFNGDRIYLSTDGIIYEYVKTGCK